MTLPAHERAPSLRLRLLVSLSQIVSLYGTLVGVGFLGTRVRDAGGGLFRPDATLLAPALPAYHVWSVIYLGLFAYTIGLWLPGSSVSARLRRTAWPASLSMILNSVWLIVVSWGYVTVSVIVIVVLVLLLAVLMRRLVMSSPPSRVERVVVEGTFGLYLGWVTLATAANVLLVAVAHGFAVTGTAATAVAVALLLVVAVIGVGYARVLPGKWGVLLGLGWGTIWVAVQRLLGEPHSLVVAATALTVGVVVTAAFVRRSLHTRHRGSVETSPAAAV